MQAPNPTTNPSTGVTDPGQWHDLTVVSGISPALIAQARLRTIRDPRELAAALGRRTSMAQAVPALEIPYFAPGRMTPILRRYRMPPGFQVDGSPLRYLSPSKRAGGSVRPYFPPLLLESEPRRRERTSALVLTEGEKKALAAETYGFCCVALSGVSCWRDGKGSIALHRDFDQLTLTGRGVFIAFDSDAVTKPDVQREELLLARALASMGADVFVARIPPGPPGADGKPMKVGLDDYLVAQGEQAFRALLLEARHLDDVLKDRRPVIAIGTNERRVTDEAVGALSSVPEVYQRAGTLVRIVRDASPLGGVLRPPGAPRIEPMPLPRLQELMSDCAEWVKVTEEGTESAHPPSWAVKATAARAEWPLRQLEAVVSSPVLLPDGRILTAHGYDAATGLFLLPNTPAVDVPEHPTADECRRAGDDIVEAVRDFPFAAAPHLSAWVAALLTILARFAFRGPSPLVLVDAAAAGTGKGRLVEVAAEIATGRPMAVMPPTTVEEEEKKRITAIAIAGELTALIDNVVGTLGTPALCAALTQTTWTDRILGVSRMMRPIPLLTQWFATGNNTVLGPDMARRTLHVRLELWVPEILSPVFQKFWPARA